MPHDPMTLAEFEHRIDQFVLYESHGEEASLSEKLSPFILRLLAGERERCAAHIGKAAKLAYDEASILRGQNLANQHLSERGDTLEFAEELIRQMGDPT